MKNKQIGIGIFLLTTVSLLSFKAFNDSSVYKALNAKSEITWIGNKVGGSHTGNVLLQDGHFELKDGLINAGTFVIDMTSITVTDSDSKKLYDHLRGVDFFHVEKYPNSTLEITSSKKDGGNMIVFGNLTIRNITHPITFKVVSIGKSESFMIYTANLSVDRTKYGIIYKSSAIGDNFISDNIEFNVKITGEKQSL